MRAAAVQSTAKWRCAPCTKLDWLASALGAKPLQRLPGGVIGLIECLAGFGQSSAQHRPGLATRLLQLLQACFGLGRIDLHLFERGVHIDAAGCDRLACCVTKLTRRLAPCFR